MKSHRHSGVLVRRVSRKRVCLLAVILVIAAGAPSIASAQEKKQAAKAESGRPQIAMRTVYLQEPIGRAHQITVRGELGGAGQVTLDANTCTLSQFGDTAVCTKIFFPPIDVKLRQLRLADPTGQERRIFQLDGKLDPPDASFFLIVPRRRSQPHRLVVNLANDHRRVVTLETLPPPAAKPELCKKATYRAEQADGKVTLYASGEHPTAGWKVAFEQLPIRIFPPQFRLVCFPPKGPAAQVITPFKAKTSFTADQAIPQVIVHDDAGQHKVPVVQQ